MIYIPTEVSIGLIILLFGVSWWFHATYKSQKNLIAMRDVQIASLKGETVFDHNGNKVSFK